MYLVLGQRALSASSIFCVCIFQGSPIPLHSLDCHYDCQHWVVFGDEPGFSVLMVDHSLLSLLLARAMTAI